MCVCVCVRERVCVCVCVCEREREREREIIGTKFGNYLLIKPFKERQILPKYR